jgi:hypothetical protein
MALTSTIAEGTDASYFSLSPLPTFKLDRHQLPGKCMMERGDETD